MIVIFYFRTAKLIMREMIQTERDYVKALEYVIEVSSFDQYVIYMILSLIYL